MSPLGGAVSLLLPSVRRAVYPIMGLLSIIGIWTELPAAPGEVLTHQKIGDTEGGFNGTLGLGLLSLASLGDLDGDGVGDLAIGSSDDDDGGTNRGAVWILFLNSDGTVGAQQKISDTEGGFSGTLADYDVFGGSAGFLGDLDGDGVGDLAIGATGDDDGGDLRGAVWILFLNPDGMVRDHQKISDTEGGFTGTLRNRDKFGASPVSLGDLDGDGVGDLAVGALTDSDGGAVWILFLNPDGTVKAHQKIDSTEGGFTGELEGLDFFGNAEALGDLDGDGVTDLAVGAHGDDDGGADRGALWMLFLNTDGTVKAHQKISDTEGGLTGTLDDFDHFGRSIASLGDLDGDGVGDLSVGAWADDDGGNNRGAVWILFLNPDGTVKAHQKISDTDGGFTGTLDDNGFFGGSGASLGDLDGDGIDDLVVGETSSGGSDESAVWVLFLDGVLPTPDPVALLDDLIAHVASLGLSHGTKTSLMAKLRVASLILGDLQENNDHVAANMLGAFIRHVEALNGKKVAAGDADALVKAAEEIITLLEQPESESIPGTPAPRVSSRAERRLGSPQVREPK